MLVGIKPFRDFHQHIAAHACFCFFGRFLLLAGGQGTEFWVLGLRNWGVWMSGCQNDGDDWAASHALLVRHEGAAASACRMENDNLGRQPGFEPTARAGRAGGPRKIFNLPVTITTTTMIAPSQ